jgi:hypothetical protein
MRPDRCEPRASGPALRGAGAPSGPAAPPGEKVRGPVNREVIFCAAGLVASRAFGVASEGGAQIW